MIFKRVIDDLEQIEKNRETILAFDEKSFRAEKSLKKLFIILNPNYPVDYYSDSCGGESAEEACVSKPDVLEHATLLYFFTIQRFSN